MLSLRKLDPGVAKAIKLKAFEMGISPSDYVAWLHFDYLKRSSEEPRISDDLETMGNHAKTKTKKKKKKR